MSVGLAGGPTPGSVRIAAAGEGSPARSLVLRAASLTLHGVLFLSLEGLTAPYPIGSVF